MATSDIRNILEHYHCDYSHYERVYKDLHLHPELSLEERRTANVAADHLENHGFKTRRSIGGYGVVGVMENGEGPVVLCRADMDALPIREQTGLTYASTAHMQDTNGKKQPVMHACGHDTHVTALMATAEVLSKAKGEWAGTLVALFQPNEELGGGADAMVKDGLYQKIPKPDVLLAQHTLPSKSGTVSTRVGPITSEASTVEVRIHGRGGHGSMPQMCVDPNVIAAYIIVRLQAIISRGMNPDDAAVVTCGSIHGGDAANVIPEQAQIGINVRTYDRKTHQDIIESIKRIVEGECEIARCPKKPDLRVTNHFPLTNNDPTCTKILQESFAEMFGENYMEMPRSMASEDFSSLATAVGAPCVYWAFGATDCMKYDDAISSGNKSQIPGNHSATFGPVLQPTLKTGIDAMIVAALTMLRGRTVV